MTGSRWSIRTRLTLTIALLTAVVGALAVFGGLQAFEDQIRDDAVEARLDDIADFNAEGFFFDDLDALEAAEALTDDEFADDLAELLEDDLDPTEADFVDLRSESELLSAEALTALRDLAELGLDQDLFDEYGTDDDGSIEVLLYSGAVARVDAELDGAELIPVTEAEGPLLPQDDLFELWAVTFEQFGNSTDSEDRDLQVVVTDLDGIEVGFLVDLTDELSALDGLRTSLWTAAAALTVLAAVATWFLTGRALRPVAAITDEVADITAGRLDGRVSEPGTVDEIGTLARTMNRMLERLERSDRQRRQFVSDASHELRTPLAVLRSEAEVANRAPDTTTVAAFGQVVMGETRRLEGLVEDLLALARADEAELVRGSTPVEIDVDDVVLAEARRTRRLPVDRSAVSAGRVLGRTEDLTRAIAHLLDNAARHGDSRIAVGVSAELGTVRVWVDDDGAGIDEADRDRIFDRFHRLDEARSRDRGGAGLGLAVVAETVGAMGGTARALTSPLGGARFELSFPAAP